MNNGWSWGWDAIAAIGQAVGAIFTAAAVFIALWSTILSNRKKLKIRMWAGGFQMPIQRLEITVINVGSRMITLSGVGIEINHRLVYKLKSSDAPKIKLNVGEQTKEILSYNDELMQLALSGLKKDYPIYVYATDEEGHYYEAKTKYRSKMINKVCDIK